MTLECQQLRQLLFCPFCFSSFSCSKCGIAISIQADSRWLTSCQNLRSRASCSSVASLRGRIHGRLSSECDKWNCVINLASRFNVLRDAQRLLSSPRTSIGICQRKCPGESRHPYTHTHTLSYTNLFLCVCFFRPSCSSALPHFRVELRGCHGGQLRSRLGSSHGRWRNKSPVSEVLKAV